VAAAGRLAAVRLAAGVVCVAAVGLGRWLDPLGAALGRLGRLGGAVSSGAGSSGAVGGPPLSSGLPASARPPESHALTASDTPRANTSAAAAGDHLRGIRQA